MLFLLLSCNNYQNTDSNLVIRSSLKKQALKNENGIDTLIKNTTIRGDYFYLTCDTLYVTNKKGVTILQYYLPNHIQNKKGIKIDINILSIEESIHDNYIYVSMYAGDVLPYKAILVALNQKKIIVENKRYQFYLGYSANGLYHLFEGGSSGSVRDIAVYNSSNELLKETFYYTTISDTNQLKWLGNEFYYYSDIDERFSNKRSAWSPKTCLINVQKYLWKENKTFPLNEFTQAFME
ncbi:MAG: hypothetical protein IMY72_12570 [Bacteroidetes bacterium]|nr:hypothetical protein [Bacteroidota bacterium]